MKKVLASLLLLCLLISMAPMMTFAETSTVALLDFDKVSDVASLGISSYTEKMCWMADDDKGTNQKDQKDRIAGGIVSLEKDGDNQYLKVTDRMVNYGGITIPLASGSQVSRFGAGKYTLSFDLKVLDNDHYGCVIVYAEDGVTKLDGKTYIYPKKFEAKSAEFRFDWNGTRKGEEPGDILPSSGVIHTVPADGEWHTFTASVEISTPGLQSVTIRGGYGGFNCCDYLVDNVKLVCENSVADNAASGGPVSAEVRTLDFENDDVLEQIGPAVDTEKGMWIADDDKGTNKRDQKDRPAGGVWSLEKDGDNQYLRISDRLANYAAFGFTAATSAMVAKNGPGKYAVSFDVKIFNDDHAVGIIQYAEDGKTKVDGQTYYYDAKFDAEKSNALRFTVNGTRVAAMEPSALKADGNKAHKIPADGNWHNFYTEVDLDTATAIKIRIWGGTSPYHCADYAIDNVKIVCLSASTVEIANKTDVKNEGYKINGMMLNLDDSRFASPNAKFASLLTEYDAIAYIDQYIGSHITDLVLTVNTTFMSMYPSEVWDDQLDEYRIAKENGTDPSWSAVWQRFYELGIDPWELWVNRLWENDVNPWLSFRMADHHYHNEDGILTSDWFWEHVEEYARVKYRDNTLYRGDRCFDFTYEEVREKWLAYIEEAVTKYNVYGIELDWMRDPLFTSFGNELAAMDTLTQFHRDVRKVVDKAEEKWGHEIEIAVRCGRDIQAVIEGGFDILKYCEEELIDMVIPSAYYNTDTEIPVLVWKSILAPYDVRLVPNVTQNYLWILERDRISSDIGYYTHMGKTVSNNIETMAGTAASYYAQGADMMYVFNVYGDSSNPITESQKVETDKIYPLNDNTVRWKMQTTLGSYEKVLSMRRRFTLTHEDYAGFWGDTASQLPKTIDRENKFLYLHFYTGEIKDNEKVTLMLGIEKVKMPVKNSILLYVNGVEAKYIGEGTDPYGYIVNAENTDIMLFEVDPSVINGSVVVEMGTSDKNRGYKVTYAELIVEPQA